MSERPFRLQAPANSMICTVADKADVDALEIALVGAGYSGEGVVEIGHGEEWLEVIDPDGTRHGGMKRVIRAVQRFTTEVDDRTLRAAEEALTSGKYLVAVATDGNDSQRDQVHKLMQEHNGTRIFFAGHATTQLLSGW